MMRQLGVPLDHAHIVGWNNVRDWARHLDQASATWRAMNGDHAAFVGTLQTNAMLADIYDLAAAILARVSTQPGRRPRKPEPFPRPWARDRRRIGKDPIPVAEFEKWYYGGE